MALPRIPKNDKKSSGLWHDIYTRPRGISRLNLYDYDIASQYEENWKGKGLNEWNRLRLSEPEYGIHSMMRGRHTSPKKRAISLPLPCCRA